MSFAAVTVLDPVLALSAGGFVPLVEVRCRLWTRVCCRGDCLASSALCAVDPDAPEIMDESVSPC